MEVRAATPAEHPAVMGILDASLLEVDADAVAAAIEAGDVFVAVEQGRVLGALVLAPPRDAGDGEEAAATRIDAVAVRRRRRGQGLGTALVREAAARRGRLVAAFDERVRPFWEALGFDVAPAGEPGWFVGTLEGG